MENDIAAKSKDLRHRAEQLLREGPSVPSVLCGRMGGSCDVPTKKKKRGKRNQ
ncbi:MAG: hypothetical protein MUO88_23785 [Desulfobacterales bacterium]|nr:hypothetical protein [Desulfobacterales bacterium]